MFQMPGGKKPTEAIFFNNFSLQHFEYRSIDVLVRAMKYVAQRVCVRLKSTLFLKYR